MDHLPECVLVLAPLFNESFLSSCCGVRITMGKHWGCARAMTFWSNGGFPYGEIVPFSGQDMTTILGHAQNETASWNLPIPGFRILG